MGNEGRAECVEVNDSIGRSDWYASDFAITIDVLGCLAIPFAGPELRLSLGEGPDLIFKLRLNRLVGLTTVLSRIGRQNDFARLNGVSRKAC